MILGIGADLVDIRRVERSLERFGVRFTRRFFTVAERNCAEMRPAGRVAAYAKRFAAKEACAKALGTGFTNGVVWSDIGVVSSPDGAPMIELSGGALHRLNAMAPEGMIPRVHLSLSDEYPMAQAFVVVSAVPTALIPVLESNTANLT